MILNTLLSGLFLITLRKQYEDERFSIIISFSLILPDSGKPYSGEQ
jgi:hypothetical protein